MHEQSNTIQGRDGRWYNVYGEETGATQPLPLPKVFAFERPSYSTPEEAVNIAAWRSRMGEGQYPSTPPGYGFTNSYQASPQAQALGKVLETLQDPRNAWIGVGPLAGVVKGPGWGAEVLRRYKLLGGTPETLDKALKRRNLHFDDRTRIREQFDLGTNLAGPGIEYDTAPLTAGRFQNYAMQEGGALYQKTPASHSQAGFRTLGEIHEGTQKQFNAAVRDRGEEAGKQFEVWLDVIPSGTQGNAAYGAVSRQVARMLDTPGFQFKRPVDLPVLSTREYNKAFPLQDERALREISGGVFDPQARITHLEELRSRTTADSLPRRQIDRMLSELRTEGRLRRDE